ncbi:MAG: DUF342 domain-containing protein [Spirochaetales bacterium]
MSDGNEQVPFDLFYRRGWAYLTVYPYSVRGQVYVEDVANRMKLLGVPSVSSTEIRAIINEAGGEPVRLVEWPDGVRLASHIELAIAEDEMSAQISVTPPKKGAARLEPRDVIEHLEANGVVYGIDRDAIRVLLTRERYNREVVVAKGTPPIHAKAAQIRYHFNANRGKPYLEMPFDRINLRELNFIENREEGALLAELMPPVPPRDGQTVTGRRLPANTDIEPNVFIAGQNTRYSEDRLKIYATARGNACVKNGAIVIEPVVTVQNVNYETGNIHFEGAVVVEEGIADGFVVEAAGDVQVSEGVGRATIKSGGNVLLKTGINGGGEGRIECAGNLFTKYIESSTVICERHVFVEQGIMHTDLTSWYNCVLSGRRSEVIASNLTIGGSLWCKKLGSIAEGAVTVRIGIPPVVIDGYSANKRDLRASEERLDTVVHQLEQLDALIDQGRESPKIRTAVHQLEQEQEELRESLRSLREQHHSFRERLKAAKESLVVVEDTIYKGVTVAFGDVEYHAPERGERQTILRINDRGLVNEGYNRAEPPELYFEQPVVTS